MRNRVSSIFIATLTLFSGASHGADAPAAARPVLISAERVWTGDGAPTPAGACWWPRAASRPSARARNCPCRQTPSASRCPARP
jgi:hypothetical protein